MEGCPCERREKEVVAAGPGVLTEAEIPVAACCVGHTSSHLQTSHRLCRPTFMNANACIAQKVCVPALQRQSLCLRTRPWLL